MHSGVSGPWIPCDTLGRQTDTQRRLTDMAPRHSRRTIHLPKNIHTMKTRTSIFSLLLLTTVTGVYAQSQPAAADVLLSRPLNLSLRKPGATPASTTVLIPPDQAAPVSNAARVGNEEAGVPANLPYGAGFESRQLGSTAGSGSATGGGSSGGSGGAGNGGGGGRGGAGRGR